MINDCEKAARDELNLEYDMVVRKSWTEYAKEINRLRALLRYTKKAINYSCGGDIYGNQKTLQVKRLCKSHGKN